MLLTEENLPAANAILAQIGFKLETIRPQTVLFTRVSGTVDPIEVFNTLEAAGYDVSWVVSDP